MFAASKVQRTTRPSAQLARGLLFERLSPIRAGKGLRRHVARRDRPCSGPRLRNRIASGDQNSPCTNGPVKPDSESPPPPCVDTTVMEESSMSGLLASTTINTTVAQVVGMSTTWSAASVGNVCAVEQLGVECA